MAGPSDGDAARSVQLEETLQHASMRHLYPRLPKALQEAREATVKRLQALVSSFCRSVCVSKGLAEGAGGALVPYGSFRLGVHGPASDIDALVLAPVHVTRSDFFATMPRLLKALPDVSQLHAIPDAFVPVISFVIGDGDGGGDDDASTTRVPIDLVFAQLRLPRVPSSLEELDVCADAVIAAAVDDPKCVLALNGARVTERILQLVPDVDTFRVTLRAVKAWAKRRCIYSNVMGFLGGVNWAVLTARVCQCFPRAAPSKLLARLFIFCSSWKWPAPILLCPIQRVSPLSSGREFKVWDPRHDPRDRAHRMPILTPCYPAMNSAYNVSDSSLRVMTAEFKRAAALCLEIEKDQRPWSDLFAAAPFLRDFRRYLVVELVAASAEQHHEWCGYFESRLRHLVNRVEESGAARARACPTAFAAPAGAAPAAAAEGDAFCRGKSHLSAFVLGLDFPRQEELRNQKMAESASVDDDKPATGGTGAAAGARGGAGGGEGGTAATHERPADGVDEVDLTEPWLDFLESINAWSRRGLGMDCRCAVTAPAQLPRYVQAAWRVFVNGTAAPRRRGRAPAATKRRSKPRTAGKRGKGGGSGSASREASASAAPVRSSKRLRARSRAVAEG